MENLENSTLGRPSEEKDDSLTSSVKNKVLVEVVRSITKGDGGDPETEALAQLSMKHQSQIEAFEERIRKIDSGISKGAEELNSLNKEVGKSREEAKALSKSNNRIETLVWAGFFVLLLTVVVIALAYFQYISSDSMKYQSDMARTTAIVEKQNIVIEQLQRQSEDLQEKNEAFQKVIFCLKNRKYWEIHVCFDGK